MSIDAGFYRAFEERFRGERAEIKQRLQVYRPFLAALREVQGDAPAIDLGCGRGEWLEVLREAGIPARGVDLDEGMLAACREAGLAAENRDALAELGSLPAESHALVSAFHVVEHLPFEAVHELVREALRVLRPGGLLVMETPNPENLMVGTAAFYMDPTHRRPIPPGLLAFVTEHYGFAVSKVLRLQEPAWLVGHPAPILWNVLRDTSPDYAVVAQKGGPVDAMAPFRPLFEKEYGLTLETLSNGYDAQVSVRIRMAEDQGRHGVFLAEQAQARCAESERLVQDAQQLARDAQVRAQQAEAHIQQMVSSRSWRITAPLRAVVDAFSRLGRR